MYATTSRLCSVKSADVSSSKVRRRDRFSSRKLCARRIPEKTLRPKSTTDAQTTNFSEIFVADHADADVLRWAKDEKTRRVRDNGNMPGIVSGQARNETLYSVTASFLREINPYIDPPDLTNGSIRMVNMCRKINKSALNRCSGFFF